MYWRRKEREKERVSVRSSSIDSTRLHPSFERLIDDPVGDLRIKSIEEEEIGLTWNSKLNDPSSAGRPPSLSKPRALTNRFPIPLTRLTGSLLLIHSSVISMFRKQEVAISECLSERKQLEEKFEEARNTIDETHESYQPSP